MVAYGAKKIGVVSFIAWIARVKIGSPDDFVATKSWGAGWDVAGGSSYSTASLAMVKDIFDESDVMNRRLWPNPNAVPNYRSRATWFDPDTPFSSPGFTENTSP